MMYPPKRSAKQEPIPAAKKAEAGDRKIPAKITRASPR